MAQEREDITILGVDFADGDVILVDLSDGTTVELTIEDVLRIQAKRKTK